MALPHYTQLEMTGNGGPGGIGIPFEPVFQNLFEISFVLPTILQAQKRDNVMLLQQATNVTLNLTPEIAEATQKFKYSTRVFLKTPEKTHTDFTIKFNVNVNTAGSMESWNALKAWYDLAWNSQNGTLHYKADTIGTVIVNQHDKKGLVLRRVTFQNAQIQSVGAIDLSFDSNEIWTVEAKFISDYWIDETIDGQFTIEPPFVSGY